MELLDGGHFGPEQAQGHGVVAVLWSLSCPFCLRHNAHINMLQDQVEKQARVRSPLDLPGRAQNASLRIVTAVREPDADATRRYMQSNGYRFAVTLQYAALAAALTQRRSTPLTITVRPDGRLRQVIPGEMAQADVLELVHLGAA